MAANKSGNSELNDCERLQELLPAYRLGISDADEIALVESLLLSCPEATSELADYDQLFGAMLFAAPPQQPPAGLHDRILKAAGGTVSAATAPVAQPPAARRVIRFERALVGFALVAAALLIVSNAYWITRLNQLDSERSQMLGLLRGQGEVLAAVSSGNSHRVELASTQNDSVNLATVLWSPQSDVALLYSNQLPPLAEGKTYQLWFIRGQTPISGGIFQLDDRGEAVYLFHPTESMDQIDALGVSTEPASGSTAPTSNPIAVGPVQT